MTMPKEILDELLQGVERPEDLLGDARADERAKDQADGADAGRGADGASQLMKQAKTRQWVRATAATG